MTAATDESPMPPRPNKPTRVLGNGANDRQAREHYAMMLDYWIAEAQWQELRAKRLDAENGRLRAEMAHYEGEDETPPHIERAIASEGGQGG
jgi:hypothetical protein